MRTRTLLLVILMIPTALLAQDEGWRNRPADSRDRGYRGDQNMFELTPFGGYRYGGTIFADQTNLFGGRNVDVASSGNFGVSFAIPISYGMKVELTVDRQNTHFTSGGGLFTPNNRLGGFDITYFQGGLQIPFAVSRAATPYASVSAGVANLDPHVSGASSDNRFSAAVGVGVKVPISRNFGIRLEERGYFTSLSNRNNSSGCYSCYNYYDYNHDLVQGETNFGVFFRF